MGEKDAFHSWAFTRARARLQHAGTLVRTRARTYSGVRLSLPRSSRSSRSSLRGGGEGGIGGDAPAAGSGWRSRGGTGRGPPLGSVHLGDLPPSLSVVSHMEADEAVSEPRRSVWKLCACVRDRLGFKQNGPGMSLSRPGWRARLLRFLKMRLVARLPVLLSPRLASSQWTDPVLSAGLTVFNRNTRPDPPAAAWQMDNYSTLQRKTDAHPLRCSCSCVTQSSQRGSAYHSAHSHHMLLSFPSRCSHQWSCSHAQSRAYKVIYLRPASI